MAHLELCPGRDVRVTTGPEWDGDVTVEVYDKDEQSMPTCAIVLTSDEAIALGRKIIANAISTQIHMPYRERVKLASIRKARWA